VFRTLGSRTLELIVSPEEIVGAMMREDAFSRWLGIEILELSQGYCRLSATVTAEMLNGFAIAHGGISYSLADSALAFAANSRGEKAVSVETAISHTRGVQAGQKLTAEAKELHNSQRFGRYSVEIKDEQDRMVALFHGTVFRTGELWKENTR